MTNMGACCVAALLLLSAPAWADATLRGVVVRDREHGRPMAGVELTAPGANPVTTGNDGQFVLVFLQGHPGQDVTVHVSRAAGRSSTMSSSTGSSLSPRVPMYSRSSFA